MKAAGRQTYSADLAKIVHDPDARTPTLTRPKLSEEISGFSTVPDLIAKLSYHGEALPYERALALYLLLIASLWPDDNDRLVTAARIFAGALNFHVCSVPKNQAFRAGDIECGFHETFPKADVEKFNRLFFTRIGGQHSLLFTQSLQGFQHDLWEQVAGLMMIHDVLEYLVMTSSLPRISSLTFAYYAIANNFFGREGGYGIKTGTKKNLRNRIKPGFVTTAETVRAKCKRFPKNAFLSFFLTRFAGLHLIHPADPSFFGRLAHHHITEFQLKVCLSLFRSNLLKGRSQQNLSITRWALVDAIPLEKQWQSQVHTLTPEELERVFKISEQVFQKTNPISEEERESIRQKCKPGGKKYHLPDR
jgi:hypothetical protein